MVALSLSFLFFCIALLLCCARACIPHLCKNSWCHSGCFCRGTKFIHQDKICPFPKNRSMQWQKQCCARTLPAFWWPDWFAAFEIQGPKKAWLPPPPLWPPSTPVSVVPTDVPPTTMGCEVYNRTKYVNLLKHQVHTLDKDLFFHSMVKVLVCQLPWRVFLCAHQFV